MPPYDSEYSCTTIRLDWLGQLFQSRISLFHYESATTFCVWIFSAFGIIDHHHHYQYYTIKHYIHKPQERAYETVHSLPVCKETRERP